MFDNRNDARDAFALAINAMGDHIDPSPRHEWVNEWLDRVWAGDKHAALELADWIEMEWRHGLTRESDAWASKIRAEVCDDELRKQFFSESLLSCGRHRAACGVLRLQEVTTDCCRNVCRLFPWYMAKFQKQAIDAVNDFTRTKMREDGFYRRIMPPVAITNEELDALSPDDLVRGP